MYLIKEQLVQYKMKKEVWLVYDGEYPICRPSANALKIKEAAGTLHLVNARESHPIFRRNQESRVKPG